MPVSRSMIFKLCALLLAVALLGACGGGGSKLGAKDNSDDTDRTEESDETDTSVSPFTDVGTDIDESDGSAFEDVDDEDTFCQGAEGVADINEESQSLFSQPSDTDISSDIEALLIDQDAAFGDMLDGSSGSLHDDIQTVYDFNVEGFAAAEDAGARTVEEYGAAIQDFAKDNSADAVTASGNIDDVTNDLCGVSFVGQ